MAKRAAKKTAKEPKKIPRARKEAPREGTEPPKERVKASIDVVLHHIDKLEHEINDLRPGIAAKPLRPSEAEAQMLATLRKQDGSGDYRLLIERRDGVWDITMSIAPHDDRHKARGTGTTFDEAWGAMAPLWA